MKELKKAKLIGLGNAANIEFMFNPSEISLSRSMSIEQSEGARGESGQNKTSFKHPNPYELKVGNLIFDTYESGKSVLENVQQLSKTVEFSTEEDRPPIYLFNWGAHDYIRAFVKSFGCRLTLFLPDGTPVRAIIDLTLEQVDLPVPKPGQGATVPSRTARENSKPLFT